MQAVEQCVADASAGGHAATLATTLAQGACRVALECGDFAAAGRFVTMLLELSARHELRFLHDLGRCFEATLIVKQGEVNRGLIQLRDTMNEPAVARHGVWFSSFLCDLGDAYRLAGDTGMGLETVDGALERTQRLGEGWCHPELLRLKGRLTMQGSRPDDAAQGEALLMQSIEVAREQATLSWELRAATTLATIWRNLRRDREARDLLTPIYERFTEGFATVDLQNASTLLRELRL
jgi:predicted ATPase